MVKAYPSEEDRAAIGKAKASVNPVNPAYRRPSGLAEHADMVDVVQGWHIGPGAKDGGAWVCMIEGHVLGGKPMPWEYDFFPFADFCWDDAHEGWGGRPMAEVLIGYQMRLGRMMRTIQRAQDLACVPRVWRERTAELTGDQITNEIGGVGDYVGQAPVIAPGQAMPAEYYNFMWKLKEEALAEVGLSLLQSRGEKPVGLNSEPSLREYNDITNTRQVVKGQRLERMDEQAARITIALSRDLYADNKKLRVLAPGTQFLEELNWPDVDMEEDSYTLRSFAVSALPQHAVGRIQMVTELIKGGIVKEEDAPSLLGFPDLEKVMNLQTANRELALMQVDAALYEGKYIGPEPYQDLELLRGKAQQEYVFALQLKDVPRKNMEYLRRLMAEADSMLRRVTGQPPPAIVTAAPAVPPPAPVPVPGAPMAGPGGPPPMAPPDAGPLPSPALPTVAPAGVLA